MKRLLSVAMSCLRAPSYLGTLAYARRRRKPDAREGAPVMWMRTACFSMLVLSFAFTAIVSASPIPYVETFSSDNAGWLAPRVTDGGIVTPYPEATYEASGGNPPGHISGALSADEPRLYTLEPDDVAPYGDMTGLTFTVDFYLDGTVTGPDPHLVRFYVGASTGNSDYFVTSNTYSWDPNADTILTTHWVALLEENFIEWPNRASHSRTFAQVVAAPEDVGLVFADNFTSNSTLGFTGTGTIHIDNFGTIPEPSSLVLLVTSGLASLTVGWIRRRRTEE